MAVPLQCEYESTRIDSTLNLRTSIGMDVPMFPYEKSRNTRSETKPNSTVSRESLYAESFSLSTIGRDKLKDAMYNHRIMDKTIDLMHISSKARDDCSLELSSFEKEQMKTQPTRSVSDSVMDITPLGIADPVPPPAAAAAASAKQSFMDLEQEFLNCSHQRLTTKATENINPVQNAGYMEMEESRKESQRQADASFDCDMNVSDARDRLPSNGSFETESNNSTINYLGDESVLIPYDMISGKNISKKLTFRQLNDELEAGMIKVLVNGPRTPTTDRSTKQKRFWHGLDQDQDQDPMGINIRSLKPRGTLNFSENMTMSPLAQATPVAARVAVQLPREKLMVPPPDDKRKYRLSQADEMMPDTTKVFCGHEYTLQNMSFARHVEPDNESIQQRIEWATLRYLLAIFCRKWTLSQRSGKKLAKYCNGSKLALHLSDITAHTLWAKPRLKIELTTTASPALISSAPRMCASVDITRMYKYFRLVPSTFTAAIANAFQRLK